MNEQQILIDALYEIACGKKLLTAEQMIDAASSALMEFMVVSGMSYLELTKSVSKSVSNSFNQE